MIASWARESEVATAKEFEDLMRDQWPFHFAFPGDTRIEEYRLRCAGMVYSPDVLRHFAGGEHGAIEVEDRLGEVISPTLVLAGRSDRTCVPEASEAIAARHRRLPAAGLRGERAHDLRGGAGGLRRGRVAVPRR